MHRRQTHRPLPSRWLMTDERIGDALWNALERLPRGGGVVFRHHPTEPGARRALLQRVLRIARRRGLTVVVAGAGLRGLAADGTHNGPGIGLRTASAHSLAEARAARRAGADLVFVSPVFATRSHPGADVLGPAAASRIARLASVPAIALGGMDEARFTRLRGRGFYGWAGIDAWIAPEISHQKRNAVPI